MDCIARQPLWFEGLDYNHGTGHGVGAYLNVHEGPQGIGFRKKENEAVSVYTYFMYTLLMYGSSTVCVYVHVLLCVAILHLYVPM